MAAKRVLVYGATGDQGHPLVRRLLSHGHEVIAATRQPEQPVLADAPRVKTVYASFDDEASLVAASRQADWIAMSLPFVFNVDTCRAMGNAIMNAAQIAGIEKVVFNTSCYVAEHDLDLSAHDGRRAIENAMEASGIPYAVIRSVVFMDNMQRAWLKPSIVNEGIFAYPAKEDLQISWICLEDVASYLVAALENPAVTADKFLVGGPEVLLGSEVAKTLSSVLGREIQFRSLSPDQFAGNMAKLVSGNAEVKPHSIYDGMAKFYRFYNSQPTSPLAVDLAPVLAKLDVTPTPLANWAAAQNWTL